MIRRAPHQTNYVVIRNDAIRDTALTFKARGVLSLLLSMPDDWRVTEAWIVRQSESDGRESVRTAVRELIDAGYMRRERNQGNSGAWVWDTIVHEIPDLSDNQTETPSVLSDPPSSDFRESDDRESDFRESENPKSEEVPIQEVPRDEVPRNQTASQATREAAFDLFWNVYPRKREKRDARKAWDAIVRQGIGPEEMIFGLRRALPDFKKRSKEHVPYPASWLRAGGWEDEPDSMTDEERVARLSEIWEAS